MKIFGPYKKRSRTASMQLSINAIVILVMAMAVLGIGLGLIRGVLGSGKDKLMNSLESMDLSEPATAEKPLTNINNLKIKRNSEETVAIGFYNSEYDCKNNPAQLNISCKEKDTTKDMWEIFDTLAVPIGEGESKTVGAIAKTAQPAGNYACTVIVSCGTTKDENNVEIPNIAASESAFIKIIA